MGGRTNLRTYLLMAVVFISYCPCPVLATTYYVVNPGESIQAAIDAASYGDTVVVFAGTYVENITLKNGVAVIGEVIGNDPNNTIIDGNDLGSVVSSSGCDPNTVLNGFTIVGGSATNGGGMLNTSSSPTVTNCIFSGNDASQDGGGMYNSSSSNPVITNCIFHANRAIGGSGGGMCNSSSSNPVVTDCIFFANTADYDYGSGGGMHNSSSSNPVITNCIFFDNTANYGGGGMSNTGSSPTVTNCMFYANMAGAGGGIYNEDSSPMVINCTFSGNSAGSEGGGMYNFVSSPTVTNCIFWANSSVQISGGTQSVTYSDVQGGYAGTGNIDTDPLFVSASYPLDLRLQVGSPCIDAGDNDSVPVGVTTDPDGYPRIIDGDCNDTEIVDMGAYEFNYAYIGDFDYDCDVDFGDFAILALAWLSQPGDGEWNRFLNHFLGVLADNWLFGK